MPRAELDGALGIRVLRMRELRYTDAAPLGDDRPAHVRAASGLALIPEMERAGFTPARGIGRLAVIQDDAAFIAYVGAADVTALALPRGADGRRRFEVGLGNKMEKLDLESCVAVGDELWAFGSGSASAREKIAVIGHATRTFDAAPLYRRIRDELGGDVNIEGAALVGDELWLFHRGNTGARDRGPAVVRFDRAELARWLAGQGAVPEIVHAEHYNLGAARGSRLGFTDAVAVGERVFYLAAAEATDNAIDDGAVLASQLGVIAGGSVRACELVIDGAPAKAEGIAFDPRDQRRAWIAIDPDNVDAPARLYEIELVGAW
jgi:uncharacterized protein DUF6929